MNAIHTFATIYGYIAFILGTLGICVSLALLIAVSIFDVENSRRK